MWNASNLNNSSTEAAFIPQTNINKFVAKQRYSACSVYEIVSAKQSGYVYISKNDNE